MGRHERTYAGSPRGGTQGDREEDRQGDKERGFNPSHLSSPPLQPYHMNGAVRVPHTALFSLPYCPFIIITYYITCIIRTQYYFFFLHIILIESCRVLKKIRGRLQVEFIWSPGGLHLEFRWSSPGLQVYLVQICNFRYGSGGLHLNSVGECKVLHSRAM